MFGQPPNATLAQEIRMVPAWLQIVQTVATVVLLVALAILAVGTIVGFLVVRRQLQRGSEEVTKILGVMAPMLSDAKVLLGELRDLAMEARHDATIVHKLVTDADSRLRAIGQRADAHLGELDAAFGVLRDGLEDAVVSVAAVAHGVRAGTAALGLSDNGRKNGDDNARPPRGQPRIRGQRREA
jgi:hypothetical protein